jgi:protein ImuB
MPGGLRADRALPRTVALWFPDLVVDRGLGRERRAFEALHTAFLRLCPWTEAIRPGLLAFPARGPTRYLGGEERLIAATEKLLQEVDPPMPCDAGIDPERAPHTRPNASVPWRARTGVVSKSSGAIAHPLPWRAGIGVADGLFAAWLAAKETLEAPDGLDPANSQRNAQEDPRRPGRALVVPPGSTPAFLAGFSVGVLFDEETTGTLVRLGLRTLGAFAALPTASVLARFGTDAVRRQEVARGVRSEPPGFREPLGVSAPRRPETDADGAPGVRVGVQQGLWGERDGARERIDEAVTALTRLLGPEAVLVARVHEGRGPTERVVMVPFGLADAPPAPLAAGTTTPVEASATAPAKASTTTPTEASADGGVRGLTAAPWPGRLPPPSPVVVVDPPAPAELLDTFGQPVGVEARGLLDAEPASLIVEARREQGVLGEALRGKGGLRVVEWAGPWVLEERWWSPRRRRRARLQVVVSAGMALLLQREQRRWWVEGLYD